MGGRVSLLSCFFLSGGMMSRIAIAAAALWAVCLLPVGAWADEDVKVSRLEAGHVAEIHTGGVPEKVELVEQEGGPVYVIDVLRGKDRLRVEVHGTHGRLLSIGKVTSSGLLPVYRWPGVRVVAHRGGAKMGPPENTLPAIEKAIEVGADLIEIDVRQTADGQLVLMHDATVNRTTSGSRPIAEMSLAAVKELRVRHQGSDFIRVPTLEEALQAMKGRIDPDLDFKEGDFQQLLKVVRENGLMSESTLICSPNRAEQVMEVEPALRIRPYADYPLQVPELVRELRPAIVGLSWHAVTEEAVRLAHLGGCHASVDCLGSADTEYNIGQAIEIGADYILSDQPDVVIRMLKERGLRDERPPRGDPLGIPLRGAHLKYPLR